MRRLGKSGGPIVMPRIVDMREANHYGGADWIGLKETGASTLVGVEVAPLGLGLWAMLALLTVIVTAWAWEGRRR